MAYDFNSLTKQADEANNRDKFYTDFSDVDPNKLHQISELTEWMRTKAKGSDVREVIAQLFERSWLEGTKEGNANFEVAKARGRFPVLNDRLNNADRERTENAQKLAQKANKDEVTNVMTPKGTLAYASLPTSGNQVGWYYYCPDGDRTHGAGNYVWNGTSWYFGGTGDEGYNLLKEDLVDYIDKEKIISKGNELGWYNLENGQVVEKTHSSWTRLHLTKPFAFNSMRFTIGTKIKCVFVVVNGIVSVYEQAKAYDVDISNASDIYMNFFGSSFVDKYYFYYGYKPYESGYIHFQVKVNQNIVSSNDTESKVKDYEDASSMHSVTCHLKLPKTYRPYGKKTKLLMVCHGAGRGVTVPNPEDNGTWEDNTNYNALIDTFVNAGYAIFDCNGYKEDFWGCNFWGAHRGVECWRKAYEYVIKNYNVEENVSIYGFSMGGLTALNLVMNGFPNVNVVALGSPVLDPQKAFENGQSVIMGAAYGMGSTWEPIKARGCSPIERIVTIGDTEMILQNLPPIKIWYGSTEQDEIVNKNYASRFVNAIINGGGYATYREVEGENHRICFGAVQYINNEYLYWINRFNN